MKTNNKIVRDQIKKHILECVMDENENTFTSIKDAAKRLHSEFNRVANYPNSLKRLPNEQERFSNYLKGLPFSFEYMNYKIEEYLNSLGINPTGKKYTSTQMIRLYHYLIYSEMNKAIKS